MKKVRRLKRKLDLSYMRETALSDRHSAFTHVDRTVSVNLMILVPPKDRYTIDLNKEFQPEEKPKPPSIPPKCCKNVVKQLYRIN